MGKETKGLLLYYSSADQLFKMTDSQLGEFIKKEMSWYMGEAEEPSFEDARMDCMHSRLKEQVELRGYNARKQQESRARKQADLQEKIEIDGKQWTRDEVYTNLSEHLYRIQKEEGDKEMFNYLDDWCSNYDLDRKELLRRKNALSYGNVYRNS